MFIKSPKDYNYKSETHIHENLIDHIQRQKQVFRYGMQKKRTKEEKIKTIKEEAVDLRKTLEHFK